MKYWLSIIVCLSFVYNVFAQNIWDCSTYPDESGFQRRMEPMPLRIAAREFGKRSLAESKCPDTGLSVKTWAVEGETIISPYTGRTYIQGETGYFGPKARNEKGEIVAFGGDPLKYDLPPLTASLLINPNNPQARAFAGIPGNLSQQYHFACKNWARFYPLLADEMGEEWKSKFYYWVGKYAESRRPSDGYREMFPLSRAHTLVGEPGELLGGNTKDGGTENHKIMWRTSALLYSQLFPDTAKISGYTTKETEILTKEMLVDYMKRVLKTGNGEYDSQVYYPHSIEALFNLYDFSPDEETRLLAKFMLDYFFVTYGLKVVDGTIAGGQKRGYLVSSEANEMELMQWAFFNNTSRNMHNETVTIQQATTKYRPNEVICNITQKNIPLPFEAKMSRPFYHMDRAHAFAETFYCSDSYALGNVQMPIVDNPNQQMVWSIVAEGTDAPLCFSGGHPMRKSTSGHSPYTQTLQSKGTLILLTAPTKIVPGADTIIAPYYSKIKRSNLWHLPSSEHAHDFEIRNRQKYGRKELFALKPLADNSAAAFQEFFEQNQGSASSWLYFPKNLQPERKGNSWLFEANNTFIAVMPLNEEPAFLINPSEEIRSEMGGSAARFFAGYNLLVFTGKISGYIIETGEREKFRSLENFWQEVNKKSKTYKSQLQDKLTLKYQSIFGDKIEMKYKPEGLRCEATINGKKQDWHNFTRGAVYESPYVQIKDGTMKVSNGKIGYEVVFRQDVPQFKEIPVPK